MADILAGRLREAREYLGFTREQIAGRLGWPAADLERLEGGRTTITGEQIRKLSRLYRRPVAWFSGESRFEPGADLLRKIEHLEGGDRDAVLEFAEWLQDAGPPPKITRADLEAHPDA